MDTMRHPLGRRGCSGDLMAFVRLDLWGNDSPGFASIEPEWIELGKVAVNQVLDIIRRIFSGGPDVQTWTVILGH